MSPKGMTERARPVWSERLRSERLRRAPRWSQVRAAAALEEKAREFNLAVPSRESLLRMVKGWERGDHEPSDFYRSLWSIAYDVPERTLFAELPQSSLSVLGLGLVAVEADQHTGGDHMHRRDALLSGSLLGGLAFIGPNQHFRVGMTEVRDISATTRSLQRWDRQFGGWLPYQAAMGHVDSAMRLTRGTYSEKVGDHLLPAIADLCGVTGWIAYDVGQPQEALRYFSLGVQLSQQGQDQALATRLLCDMARVNADLGNPMQSFELLGLARHLAQSGLPAIVLAKLHSMEAKTFAILGKPDECQMAIHQAEKALARGSDQDTPGWISYFDEAQFSGVLGSCYRDLARSDSRFALKAEEPIRHAMKTRHPDQHPNRALDHINLATTRLLRGEIDGMIDDASRAADLAKSLRSQRVNSRLHSLTQRIPRSSHKRQGVADLRDKVSGLSAVGI